MKCINCNLELSDDAKVCHHCGAKVTTEVIRCPKCFVKLQKDTKICTKCGCNIEKTLEEEKKPSAEKVKITKKQIIIVASVVAAIIVILGVIYGIWYSVSFKAFKGEAEEYISKLDENMSTISKLAEEYNKVYNGQWLIHTEMSAALENKYKKEIASLKDSRDTFTYLSNDLSEKSVNDKDAKLVKTVFKDYDNCYIYVVGKKGKYPGYMAGYEKVLENYEKSIKALKNRVK